MDLNFLKVYLNESIENAALWIVSPNFYFQLVALITAVSVAWMLSKAIKLRLNSCVESPVNEAQGGKKIPLFQLFSRFQALVFPVVNLMSLLLAAAILESLEGSNWLLKIAQSWAIIVLIFYIIKNYVSNVFVETFLKWVGIPIATLYIFDALTPTINFLSSIAFEVGDIKITLYAVMRLIIFGLVLFWLGRISNSYGQQVIRSKKTIDIRTKEVFSKLFEISLFLIIFLILLQGVGINLTTLAVFGGALGVGIGFGLQQIASNFVSGIIILLDKSMAIGNYIEMEDGRSGTLKKLNMRSSSLETFDGKMIVVPNEKFITTSFTNWTHDDPRQRYTLEFSVAYDSDIPSIPKLILDAIKQHPQVLLEPELPDCEITKFGESGVDFQLEYWIDDIDDGKNRVGSDLLMIIWQTLHDNNIAIPFPQREVRILNQTSHKT